jgi:hypothetical protein
MFRKPHDTIHWILIIGDFFRGISMISDWWRLMVGAFEILEIHVLRTSDRPCHELGVDWDKCFRVYVICEMVTSRKHVRKMYQRYMLV